MLLQAQAQSTAHVDVDMMLPLMFDGLRNYDRSWEPRYREIARQGIIKLCAAARAKGQSLAPLVPRLISPIRDALATRDRAVVAVVIRSLQHMVAADPAVAPALAPFFRVLLPPLNMWLAHREGNGGDQMDYSQRMPTGEQKRTLRPTSKAARRRGGLCAQKKLTWALCNMRQASSADGDSKMNSRNPGMRRNM